VEFFSRWVKGVLGRPLFWAGDRLTQGKTPGTLAFGGTYQPRFPEPGSSVRGRLSLFRGGGNPFLSDSTGVLTEGRFFFTGGAANANTSRAPRGGQVRHKKVGFARGPGNLFRSILAFRFRGGGLARAGAQKGFRLRSRGRVAVIF